MYFNINSIPDSVLSSGAWLIVTAGVPSEVETIFHILLYTVFKHNYTTYFNINSIPVSMLSSGAWLIVTAGVPSEVETIFHILCYVPFLNITTTYFNINSIPGFNVVSWFFADSNSGCTI